MPKSRLSRHVSRLEERLDTRLIQRSSRQFKVTETGQVFYRHARAQLSLLMPSRRGQSPSVRVLADYLLDNLNDRIGDQPG
ncbi:Uncharacterised protein [Halioglobus japonicus]|nr:Uncharacterised protein [Halioglobus japonicus]